MNPITEQRTRVSGGPSASVPPDLFRPQEEVLRRVRVSDSVVIDRRTTGVGWDLDGTIADTEFLHRHSFFLAVAELTGYLLPSNAWRQISQRAWGEPEPQSCKILAEALAKPALDAIAPGAFETLLRNSDRMPTAVGDSITDRCAQTLLHRRREIISYFISSSSVVEGTDRGGTFRTLTMANHAGDTSRAGHLRHISVKTYPSVFRLVRSFHDRGIKQGVCTSSSETFAVPLLKKLGLLPFMQAQIGVESIPDETKRKPQPDPWLALFGHLGVQPDCSWIFENSAGGIISGFRANSHVAASTANLPPLIARFLDKLRREPVLANGFVSFVPSWNHVTLAA